MPTTPQLQVFEQLMLPHLDAAYNLARWLTRNDQDAEDVVQDAYLRALRFFGSFDGSDGKAWLLAIVRNTFFTRRSRESREPAVAFDESIHAVGETAGAEAAMIRESDRADLRGCLDGLPAEYREILVMRELEELSYKEIAYVASLPIGTVMSRLSRARRRLQECMARSRDAIGKGSRP